ncbi:urease accessory protein UreF [Acidocella aminolytica]|jgi:urease accessory protein|uniref:Urease accessory protein UreF n=1 Tax=Acidocella aminolytica 101 = DSM 11237 TaxID=1120923 RepID=A0A0D6PEZ4_9PROT|nr:urease accessory UreF family protein [Acidocella aminolytica]GAN80320.1 urease accessory protein UreF [Acidocella aminolytica 101 = DSM 11237]GBQ33378.1 urease accessory protein UreF [Acidocella aminolytica 101 = DSM 11237]SHF49151.1 urease accessory protein [Acidocella aminolytica 101 = DSM 11237]
MSNILALLRGLQFADGQFPSGGFAFSWGVESLAADGLLTRATWPEFLTGQMEHRWAPHDRPLVAHAFQAWQDQEALMELDELTEALSIATAAREGSRRAGAALLGTHARLGTPGAASYRTLVTAEKTPGHLPVITGLVLAGAGLDLATALAVSAHSAAQSLGSAAVRLGIIGALDAQTALQKIQPWLAEILAAPIPPVDEIGSFTPLADIAMMRHPFQQQQLFSN